MLTKKIALAVTTGAERKRTTTTDGVLSHSSRVTYRDTARTDIRTKVGQKTVTVTLKDEALEHIVATHGGHLPMESRIRDLARMAAAAEDEGREKDYHQQVGRVAGMIEALMMSEALGQPERGIGDKLTARVAEVMHHARRDHAAQKAEIQAIAEGFASVDE